MLCMYGVLCCPCVPVLKVVKSLVRLKADLSRMLVQQKPDVVFTESMAASSSYSRKDAGGMVAEAHLAVLR